MNVWEGSNNNNAELHNCSYVPHLVISLSYPLSYRHVPPPLYSCAPGKCGRPPTPTQHARNRPFITPFFLPRRLPITAALQNANFPRLPNPFPAQRVVPVPTVGI